MPAIKLGMLVMDENRYLASTEEYQSQFAKPYSRDRNHPSVYYLVNRQLKKKSTLQIL